MGRKCNVWSSSSPLPAFRNPKVITHDIHQPLPAENATHPNMWTKMQHLHFEISGMIISPLLFCIFERTLYAMDSANTIIFSGGGKS